MHVCSTMKHFIQGLYANISSIQIYRNYLDAFHAQATHTLSHHMTFSTCSDYTNDHRWEKALFRLCSEWISYLCTMMSFRKLLCIIHTPYWLLMVTREGASGLGRTMAFLKCFNNVISPILPTLMEWNQWIVMCACNYVMKFTLSQIYFMIFEK